MDPSPGRPTTDTGEDRHNRDVHDHAARWASTLRHGRRPLPTALAQPEGFIATSAIHDASRSGEVVDLPAVSYFGSAAGVEATGGSATGGGGGSSSSFFAAVRKADSVSK